MHFLRNYENYGNFVANVGELRGALIDIEKVREVVNENIGYLKEFQEELKKGIKTKKKD